MSRREWVWTLVLGVVILAATCVPYGMAWRAQTAERRFGGCILLVDDCYSYLAKMRQGAEGAWLFRNVYTPEPHPPALVYPFYLLLGKIGALLPGAGLAARMVWTYHGARMVLGLGLLFSVYRFLASLTPRVAVRRTAWLLVAVGGGLGWVPVILGEFRWLGSLPLDLYLPEGFAFLAMSGFPHIALAQSLLLWGILFLLRAWEVQDRPWGMGWALLAGGTWLAMGLVISFYVGVAWAVVGMMWLALMARRRTLSWMEGVGVGVAVFVSAPVVAYNGWLFAYEEVYAAWARQNQILSPHPLHFLAAYGPLLVLAGWAVRAAWRDAGWAWLSLAWLVTVPVLIYLPFGLQRRLIVGAQVMLCFLAAWGAGWLWRSRRRWLVLVFLMTMMPTNVILLASSGVWVRTRPSPAFRDRAEIGVMSWLDRWAVPDDVVLGSYATGNYLPVQVTTHVFLGHGLETVDAEEKEAQVGRFFTGSTTDAWRQHLLLDYGVSYVFWGPEERVLGDFDPRQAAYLEMVGEEGEYAIFAVGRLGTDP